MHTDASKAAEDGRTGTSADLVERQRLTAKISTLTSEVARLKEAAASNSAQNTIAGMPIEAELTETKKVVDDYRAEITGLRKQLRAAEKDRDEAIEKQKADRVSFSAEIKHVQDQLARVLRKAPK